MPTHCSYISRQNLQLTRGTGPWSVVRGPVFPGEKWHATIFNQLEDFASWGTSTRIDGRRRVLSQRGGTFYLSAVTFIVTICGGWVPGWGIGSPFSTFPPLQNLALPTSCLYYATHAREGCTACKNALCAGCTVRRSGVASGVGMGVPDWKKVF